MRLEFDASPEDIRLFLDEAEELLQLMEGNIVRLEQKPDALESLQEIFRAAHTLKGSSATLGHRKMAEVTHAMESLLDKLRKGRLRATGPVVDLLFGCTDVLKSFILEIAEDRDCGIETAEVLGRLAQMDGAGAPVAQAAAAATVVAAGIPMAVAPAQASVAAPHLAQFPDLSALEQAHLASLPARGLTAWDLQVAIAHDAPMPAVRAFQVLLAIRELGEVIRSWPGADEIEQDQVGSFCRVLYASKASADQAIQALAVVPDVQVTACLRVSAPGSAAAEEGDPGEGGEAGAGEGAADAQQGERRFGRTVRVDVDALDNLMNQVGELVIDRTRLSQILSQLSANHDADEWVREVLTTVTHIGRVTSELQAEVMRARMLPVDHLFKKFPRMVRDVTQKAGKEITFIIRGEETELDRSVIEEIGDPLMHLLRNAIDHGVEPPDQRVRLGKPRQGAVVLEARHEENQILIIVKDDGRGIQTEMVRKTAVKKGLLGEDAVRRLSEAEALNLIFLPGFTTAEQVSDISGRGVGLDVVQKNIDRLNGTVEVISNPGQGTEFRIRLPLTLAIIRALMVQYRDDVFAIPLRSVSEAICLPVTEIQTVRQREVLLNRGTVVPLLRLHRVFGSGSGRERQEENVFVVVVNLFGRQVGVVVDGLVGEGDVVIKSLGKFVGETAGISGATILGDGSVALILDVAGLATMADQMERAS